MWNFLPSLYGGREKGREEGPDSHALVWHQGTKKEPARTCHGDRCEANRRTQRPGTFSIQGVREAFSGRSLRARQREFQNQGLAFGAGLGRGHPHPLPLGPLASWFLLLKMSTLPSFPSKHPSTLTSARRCAREPCGTGQSAPSATWTFSSTSWW